MRALILALCLAIALPARADVDAAKLRRSVYDRRVTGTLLVVIGSLNVALSLATVAAYELAPTCSYAARCFDELGAGAIGLASAAVAIPTLGAGITQLGTASSDAFAAGQGVPPEFFVTRAERRRRLGRALTAVGISLTGAAIILGGGARAELYDEQNRSAMPALATLSGISGAAGLALVSVGAALWSAAR